MIIDIEVFDMEVHRGTSLKALLAEGWEPFKPLMPPEKNPITGKIRTNFWYWVKYAPGTGGNGNVDLSGVYAQIDTLSAQVVAVNGTFDTRLLALESAPGGGSSPMTREFPVDIYVDNTPMPSVAYKDAMGYIKGNSFAAQFTIDNGLAVPEGKAYYIRPPAGEGPSGYAGKFIGDAIFFGGDRGDQIQGFSTWSKSAGKWAVRMQSPNYDLNEKVLGLNFQKLFNNQNDEYERHVRMAGGDMCWNKRFPMIANHDTIRVRIDMP